MIKITVWMYPHGNASDAKEIAEMKIWNNMTGTRSVGNYEFRITKASMSGKLQYRNWKSGAISGFHRLKKNVWHLIYMVLKEALSNDI